MSKLYKYMTNELPQYDDILNSNLTREEKAAAITARGNAYNAEVDRQKRLNKARIALGGLTQGASFLPFFNVPYIGTGLGGAMYDLGQGIIEGDKMPDLAKRTGKGFLIGETVGAIPYAGKFAGRTKAGQAVLNSNIVKNAGSKINEAAEKFTNSKLYDELMSDIKAFNPNKQTAYHGSPHEFNKFSNDAIGTGEGAQAHGMGHYAAFNKEVADKNYRQSLTGDNFDNMKYFYAGKEVKNKKEKAIISTILDNGKEKVLKVREKNLPRYKYDKNEYNEKLKEFEFIKNIDENLIRKDTNKGQLYKISIPKNDVMLREGAIFENQPRLVQKGLKNIQNDYIKSKGYNTTEEINNEMNRLLNQYENIVKNESPWGFGGGAEKSLIQAKISDLENLKRFNETRDIYEYLKNHMRLNPEEVTGLLQKQGIKGISYNGGIDGEAAVIFNPDDIDIVRKYYNQPKLWEYLTKRQINKGASANALFDYLTE